MKTTKRVLAVVLAVLMIAMTISFACVSASAAENYELKLTSTKEGFAFEVIKVGTIDTATGLYTADNTNVQNALNAGNVENALKELDKIDWSTASYTPVFEWKTNDTGVKTVEVDAGFYYVRTTDTPDEVTSYTNRLIPVPYYNGTEWITYNDVIDLASKISIEPVITKAIVENGTLTDHTVVAKGELVDFRLTATVTGSVDNKLSSYSIIDTMEKGITFKDDTVSVKLTKKGTADKTLAADTEYTVVPANDGTTSFRVNLASSVLDGNAFYSYSNVVVDFKGYLNDDCKIGRIGNENRDDLEYVHKGDPEVHTKPGDTVYVFTIKIDVEKVDAGTNQAIKNNAAEFTLFAADKTTVVKSGSTDNDGNLSFIGLGAGTYYVQETKAPTGYNLNTTMFEVKLDPTFNTDASGVVTMAIGNSDTVKVTVKDTESVMPKTGGQGTMLFTIIGAGLILVAGALFVVVLKKKSSK